jgi:hypothetical protein
VEYTCPYRDSLFATLTIDPASGRIDVKGRESKWVGKSPSQLGVATKPNLADGKEICPKIRNRQLESNRKGWAPVQPQGRISLKKRCPGMPS